MNEELRSLITWSVDVRWDDVGEPPDAICIAGEVILNRYADFGMPVRIPFAEVSESRLLAACKEIEAEIAKQVGCYLEAAKTLMEML